MSALPFLSPSANEGRLLQLLKQVAIYTMASLVLVVSGATHALEQYWVSVGSFSSQENANRLLGEVTQHTDADARIRSLARSGEKKSYRVVVGPYVIKSVAYQQLLELQIQYEGVWIWTEHVDERDQRPPSSSASDLPKYREQITEIDFQTLNTNPTNTEDPEKEKKFVEEPPAGYELHKLRRNQ